MTDTTPDRLRALRARMGLTLAASARHLGVPIVTLRAWERGIRGPNAAALRLLDLLCRIETEAPDLHARLVAEASQRRASDGGR